MNQFLISQVIYSGKCYEESLRIGEKAKYYYGHIDKDTHNNLYLHHKINPKEFNKAIKVITTYMMQNNNAHSLQLNLDEKNEELAPAKEMTLEEIEKELGYKVKVVNEKQDK